MRSCSYRRSANASVLLIILLGLAATTGCILAPRAQSAESERGDQRSERAEKEDAADERREHEAKGAREHDEPALQEIIVTAQKREESLQKVPVAVTAVTGDELQHAGITDAQGLTDVVPGLEVGNFGSTTNFTIRGVTTNTDPNLGDSPTAFHIDGVYQGRPAAASGLFYDVDRLEVLSGPQGTLYGKDSTGGTINLITRKPSFAGTSAEFTQEWVAITCIALSA